MKLKNTLFVITGAAGGIGGACAKLLARNKARLILCDKELQGMEEIQSYCESLTSCTCYTLDVTNEESVNSVFGNILSAQGCPQGLVHCAGILKDGLLVRQRHGELEPLSLTDWQNVINTNLTGCFLLGRAMASAMIKMDKKGVIVNISSVAAQGNYGQSSYSASKAGVNALVTCWSKELAQYGIRVVAIAPGVVNTSMISSLPEKALGRLIGSIATGRLAEVEEMADAILFVIKNEYMNGRVLAIDGGISL